jgi:hypothetical protein
MIGISLPEYVPFLIEWDCQAWLRAMNPLGWSD